MRDRSGVVLFAVAIACGPRVPGGGAGSEEGSGGVESTSTTAGSSSTSGGTADVGVDVSTGVVGCEREGALQWAIEGDSDAPWASAAVALPVGGFALVGRDGISDDADALIEARDADGAVLWSRTYAGVNALQDEARDVAVASDGSIYVTVTEYVVAMHSEKSPSYDARVVVLRYTPAGDLDWRWEHERPPAKMYDSYIPSTAIRIVGDRVLVLEWTRNGPTALVELDASGGFVSEVELPLEEPAGDTFRSLGRDGDVAVAQHVGDFGNVRIGVERFASDGTSRWSKTFGNDTDDPLVAIAGASGETYLGFTPESEGELDLVMLTRFEADGTEAWTLELPIVTPYANPPQNVIVGTVTSDGALLLTAEHHQLPLAPPGEDPQMQPLWAARYTPDGCAEWIFETEFPAPGYGWGHAIVEMQDGAALVLASYRVDAVHNNPAWMGWIE